MLALANLFGDISIWREPNNEEMRSICELRLVLHRRAELRLVLPRSSRVTPDLKGSSLCIK